MTFEEAKKILGKEFAVIGLHESAEPFEFDGSGWIGHEKPSVPEAFRVLSREGYHITISGHDYDMRKKRLEKEYGENTKSPGPGEDQPNEKVRIIFCSASGEADFYYKHILGESNPALNESASRFNDALSDEQGKKIKRLGKEIAKLNGIIHEKNLKIEELGKESSRHLAGKMKMFGESFALEEELKDKDAVLADVAEELRLSRIREKNLTEVSQKYIKANEELKEKLAEKTNLVEMVRKGSREYCEYGIAAGKMIQDMAKVIVGERAVDPEDFEEYRRLAKGYRFNPQLPERTDEEEKKLNTAKSTLGDLKEKAYDSLNAKAHDPGPAGSRDGNGISGQMIGVDIAGEGGDHPAVIAQCCKNMAISKDEAEIIGRCTKNGTELHYSEKDGFTYTNMFGDEMPVICLRGMCQVFTDEEIKNMKK